MRRPLIATTLAAALAALSLPSRAAAEETAIGAPGTLYGPGGFYDGSKHERRQQLSGFAFVPWWASGFGFGLGGRYGLPLVHDGILPDLNDSIGLELGLDAWYGSWAYGAHGTFGYMGLAAPVTEATWTFHITDHFDAYAKLGLGWHFELYSGNTSRVPDLTTNGLYLVGGAGINYTLSEAMTFRAELGYLGLRAGIAFAL